MKDSNSYVFIFCTHGFHLQLPLTVIQPALYNPSYPGAGPAQESKGVAIHRWQHQVHAHCPPAPAVALGAVETSLHSAALQPHDQEALCKVVHGLKPVVGKLRHIKGGGLVVTVQQNALVKKEKLSNLT